jgi:hypothetical protein
MPPDAALWFLIHMFNCPDAVGMTHPVNNDPTSRAGERRGWAEAPDQFIVLGK